MNTNERDEFERRLDEDDGAFPESWKPKPGDRVVGTLRKYDQGEGRFGPRWIAVLETRNEQGQPYLVGVWLSHAVLIDQFKRLRPKPGERLGIKRLADVEGPNGRYAKYVVKVDRPVEERIPDWDAVEGLGREDDGGDVRF